MTENKEIEVSIVRNRELKKQVGDKLKETEVVGNHFTGELTVIFNQGGVRDIKKLSII